MNYGPCIVVIEKWGIRCLPFRWLQILHTTDYNNCNDSYVHNAFKFSITDISALCTHCQSLKNKLNLDICVLSISSRTIRK
jgi:hypothetical protein